MQISGKNKEVIVEFRSGLGNQMFQYALYEKLLQIGMDVYGDIENDFRGNELRDFSLDVFPNISIKAANEKKSARYFKKARKLKNSRMCRGILGKLYNFDGKVYVDRELGYDEKVFKGKYSYLSGYWQTEKYFSDIKDTLLYKFSFPELEDSKNQEYSEQIMKENSVSLHVRRGDYVNEKNYHIFGNICTLEYYQRAIEYFETKYTNVTFFVFSNDIEWAKKNLKMKKAIYVEGNDEKNGYKDMCLMAKCKHNIIANSSFSWWGAWLNQNEGQEVIAPAKWINNGKMQDIWCDGWKRL